MIVFDETALVRGGLEACERLYTAIVTTAEAVGYEATSVEYLTALYDMMVRWPSSTYEQIMFIDYARYLAYEIDRYMEVCGYDA